MNPPNGQTPLDYLNQIAPQTPKKQLFVLNMRTVLLGGVVAVVLIIILASIANGVASAQKEPWFRLSARLSATSTIVNNATSNIKSSQLRSINSDIKLYLANTQRDLATPLQQLDVPIKKMPSSIADQEASTSVEQRLEVGRLNARYDSTYAREMTYHIATILSLLQDLYANTSGTQTRAFLETAYSNLTPTYEALSAFSTATE